MKRRRRRKRRRERWERRTAIEELREAERKGKRR
jgi:hypothetical protein